MMASPCPSTPTNDSDVAEITPTIFQAAPLPSTNLSAFRKPPSIAEQLELITSQQLRGPIAKLPRVFFNDRAFILQTWIKRKGGKKPSWVTHHGYFLLEVINNKTDRRFWMCSICDRTKNPENRLFAGTATSSAADHLMARHQISASIEANKTPSVAEISLHDLRTKKRKVDAITSLTYTDFKEALIHWVVDANIPLAAVEHKSFQRLIHMPKEAIQLMPESHSTVKNWLLEDFNTAKGILKERLSKATSIVHLTFDSWTSPNQLGLLSIVCHFLDEQHRSQTRLLGLKRIQGPHSGENFAQAVAEAITSFELYNLGFFTLDNIPSNDTGVRHLISLPSLMHTLNPALKNPAFARLRCIGHIINLVAQAFITGTERSSTSLPIAPASCASIEEMKEWAESGPVARLYNLVTFIRRSPQRRDSFAISIQHYRKNLAADDASNLFSVHHNIQLINCTATRWNSTLAMISRAIRLKEPVMHFIAVNSNEAPNRQLPLSAMLTSNDWDILQEIKDLLQPCREETKRFESRQPGSISWVIQSLQRLSNHFTKERDNRNPASITNITTFEPRRPVRATQIPHHLRGFELDWPIRTQRNASSDDDDDDLDVRPAAQPHNPVIQRCCHAAMSQLTHYLGLLDHSPAYWAAVILHPSITMRWIESTLPHRAASIKQTFKEFFFTGWAHEVIPTIVEEESEREDSLPDLLPRSFYEQQAGHDGSSTKELASWFSTTPMRVTDPIHWWLQVQNTYPLLGKMAIDILTIPSMSAECERTFSLAKLTVSSQRHSLQDSTLEATECLRNWKKAEGFSDQIALL